MTEVPCPMPSPGVTVLGVGEFGQRVAALLHGHARWPVTMCSSAADADRQDARAFVAALWRPCPAACEEADVLAFAHQRPWLPVVMDHPHVRVGPLIAPGQGPCFACFTARYDQHDSQPGITARLRAAYERDADFGPRGYLDHHARLAVALAEMALGDLSAGWLATTAGQVMTFNVYRGTVRRHPVIPRSGCPRCSPPASAGDSSVMAGLLHAISAERVARHVPYRGPELREAVDGR